MMTRRTGAAGAAGGAGAAATGSVAEFAGAVGAAVAAGAGVDAAPAAAGTTPTAGAEGGGVGGFTTTGAVGMVEATAAAAGRTTTAGGRGGATVYTGAGGRGMGTMRRGAGGPSGVCVDVGAAATGCGVAVLAGRAAWGVEAGGTTAIGGLPGATTATDGRCGGAFFAASACCLRSRMARAMSPGLEAAERSSFLGSAGARLAVWRYPPLKYPRTFSASSASMELECVFFSVTPTALSASRMALLFSSSSRARSFMRTLLIQSFWFPALTGLMSVPAALSYS